MYRFFIVSSSYTDNAGQGQGKRGWEAGESPKPPRNLHTLPGLSLVSFYALDLFSCSCFFCSFILSLLGPGVHIFTGTHPLDHTLIGRTQYPRCWLYRLKKKKAWPTYTTHIIYHSWTLLSTFLATSLTAVYSPQIIFSTILGWPHFAILIFINKQS